MKIAVVAISYLPISDKSLGGVEVFVYELCRKLNEHGHDVTLFGLSDSVISGKTHGIISSEQVTEDKLALDDKLFVRRLVCYQQLAIIEALKNANNFDAIHINVAQWEQAFTLSHGENITVTAHGNYMTKRLTKMLIDSNPKPKLATISKFVSHEFFPEYKNKYLVYNGVDVDKFTPNYQPDDYLVWLGRITPVKAPHLAIEIAKKASQKLILAGHIDYQDYFDEKIKPHLNNDIQYVGTVSGEEKAQLLSSAKALLFPLDWDEPFGLVPAEAMASGTPVIAMNRGAISEIVENQVTGFVVETVEEMTDKVKLLDKIDRKKCRARVEELFSLDRMASEYEKLYMQQSS